MKFKALLTLILALLLVLTACEENIAEPLAGDGDLDHEIEEPETIDFAVFILGEWQVAEENGEVVSLGEIIAFESDGILKMYYYEYEGFGTYSITGNEIFMVFEDELQTATLEIKGDDLFMAAMGEYYGETILLRRTIN